MVCLVLSDKFYCHLPVREGKLTVPEREYGWVMVFQLPPTSLQSCHSTEPHLTISFIAHKCSVPPNEPYFYYLAGFFSRYLETCFWCSCFKKTTYFWGSYSQRQIVSYPLALWLFCVNWHLGLSLTQWQFKLFKLWGSSSALPVPSKKSSNQMQWTNSQNLHRQDFWIASNSVRGQLSFL